MSITRPTSTKRQSTQKGGKENAVQPKPLLYEGRRLKIYGDRLTTAHREIIRRQQNIQILSIIALVVVAIVNRDSFGDVLAWAKQFFASQ